MELALIDPDARPGSNAHDDLAENEIHLLYRVTEDSIDLAWIHGVFGQAIFALMVVIAAVSVAAADAAVGASSRRPRHGPSRAV